MTREERELSITYLEGIKEKYIEGEGYERHPLPEYYAIETAIKALEQEPKSDVLDKIRAEVEEYSLLTRERVIRIIDKYKAESEVRR